MRVQDYAQEKDNYNRYHDVESLLKYGVDKPDIKFDLSIVIPTFDRPRLLKSAVESAVQKFYGLRVEIIIVDNSKFNFIGSEVEKILKEIDYQYIKYYQNDRNIGMLGNWNRCIELAKAPWIAMLHDDDLLAPNYYCKIKKILKKLDNDKNVCMVKANSLPIKKGNICLKDKIKKLLSLFFINSLMIFNSEDLDFIGPDRVGLFGACSCGSLLNKSVYLKYGGFDDTHYPSADAQYPEKLVTQYGYNIGLSMEYLGFYRWEDNASYKESTIIGWAEEYALYSQYYSKRSVFAKERFDLYSNEMGNNQKEFFFRCLSESRLIMNKDKVKEIVDKLIPTKENKKLLQEYKKGYLIYYRTKQIKALFD